MKKIKKEDENQSLDYLNEYVVEACFNIFDIKNEYLENWTFLRDIETFFSFYEFIEGVGILKSQGYLGKLITVGSLLDLAAFGILLKMNKELMARGVVLAVFVLTIATIFML